MNESREEKFLPGQHIIDGYGRGGFRFADMSHQGNILSLPSGMCDWAVTLPTFGKADFVKVFAESEKIDMFLLGCGLSVMPILSNVRQIFKEYNIAFDPMLTAAAARTYNILLAEGRRVSCGLIAVS